MAMSRAKIGIAMFAVFGLCLFSSEGSNAGFSVDLVHRDSPKSPLYDPSLTRMEQVRKAISRSISRANSIHKRIRPTADEPSTGIANADGAFVMNITIGTPPVPIVGIADTGSDLIWTQCEPCTDCFQQTDPIFDPSGSSTYRKVACSSQTCSLLEQSGCGSSCTYSYSYGDQSYTRGDVATDTVSLSSTSGRRVAFPKTVIGCGHENGGTFMKDMSGIIGLGGGPLSLIRQMGKATGSKFAYCLVPFGETKSSKLSFGTKAVISGNGTVKTPLLSGNPDTFYFLTLEAISVGKTKIPFSSSSSGSASEGNIIIDSGTTLTLLPEDFYSKIESALTKAISLEPVTSPIDAINLCYQVSSDSDLKVPVMTAHFTGANVKLSALNTFIRVSANTMCFSFAPIPATISGTSIYGNLAQVNFQVGYDVGNGALSFKPADCTKF